MNTVAATVYIIHTLHLAAVVFTTAGFLNIDTANPDVMAAHLVETSQVFSLLACTRQCGLMTETTCQSVLYNTEDSSCNLYQEIYADGMVKTEAPWTYYVAESLVTSYAVAIHTGADDVAGTYADICIILHGETTNSLEMSLNSEHNFIARLTVNAYFVYLPDLGALTQVDIRLCSTFRNAWFLDTMVITDYRRGTTHQLNCYKWLSENKDDPKLGRTLDVANGTCV